MTGFNGRYVFIAGLHRTGTSLISRLLGAHSDISAIHQSPVPENEGCYLQGAIPHTALHGRPGHFATDLGQHLIEGCGYDTMETRCRIEADWDKWFGIGDCWRVEKSPVNLTRSRLYQQLFPTSQFIFILRHPVVMAAALAKWIDIPQSSLIDYALDAYDVMADDIAYLHCALTLRYEDLVKDPGAYIRQAFSFLDLGAPDTQIAIRNCNADYTDIAMMTKEQAERAMRWGYGSSGTSVQYEKIVRHPLRSIREGCNISKEDEPNRNLVSS